MKLVSRSKKIQQQLVKPINSKKKKKKKKKTVKKYKKLKMNFSKLDTAEVWCGRSIKYLFIELHLIEFYLTAVVVKHI